MADGAPDDDVADGDLADADVQHLLSTADDVFVADAVSSDDGKAPMPATDIALTEAQLTSDREQLTRQHDDMPYR